MAEASPANLHKDLMKICVALEKRYEQREHPSYDDFIECLVYQILELATTEKAAHEALKRIREEYVDWNDMRVASVREIQDILGPRYVRCREKAEDLASLLADLYTAFRRMDLTEVARTPEGIETLRALPETTLIREDMVERGLLQVCGLKTFPTDDEQFEILKFLGGVPEDAEFPDFKDNIEEVLDTEELLRLSRGLREHADLLVQHDEFDPQPISYGWDQNDPLTKKKPIPAKKKEPPKKFVPPPPPPKPEPVAEEALEPKAEEAAPEPVPAPVDEAPEPVAVSEQEEPQPEAPAAPEPAAEEPTPEAPPAEEKPAKKKATAKKAVPEKKTAEKKAAPAKKKAAAKKAAPEKKAAAKKAAPAKKKAAAKKAAPEKKAAAKKTTKKAAAKKTTKKAAPEKKTAAKKSTKKAAAKKTTKKAATKKAAAKKK